MEIPQEVLDKLKCSECDELLSCGPVYLLHETGRTICGRCSQQPEDSSTKNTDRTRNDPYEATASLFAFPCAFSSRGCPEKQKFSLGQPPHESICEFRPFICPIAPRGSCDWIGSLSKLKIHCDEKHASNVLENPSNLPRPDLTASNLQTFLISAFRFLFLLQIKVCVASGKLFHSVRMLGDSKYLDTFSFSLEIEGNNIKVTKLGSVLRAGILTIQEPTAICTTINNLLGIFDGKYCESKFTITIQTLMKFCLNCRGNVENESDAKFCEECNLELMECKFNRNGCLFVDVNPSKRKKHEIYFCKHQTKCCLCKVNLVGGSFVGHLGSLNYCRKRIKSNIDSVVRVTPNSSYSDILFSSNHIGNIICSYYLSNSNFELDLYTSLPSYELKNFTCSIEITDPQTKHTQILTARIKYDKQCDWTVNKKIYNLPSWKDDGVDIKINLYKNVDY